jgi:hypothetical protein
MDVFVLIVVGIFVALALASWLLGRYHPRSVADVLDWRPTRSPEVEAQNELDDIQQMLDAANERRRRRGAPELTEAGIRAQVAEDERFTAQRREQYLAEHGDADEDMRQLLEATNERRRRRGEPELSEQELRAELEA